MRRFTCIRAVTVAVTTAGLPVVAHAQLFSLDKLQVHGYLTQGYAGSSDIDYNGIPTDPTANYRTAALQLRYGFTSNDAITIQVRHRRLGDNPLQSVEPDVSLNWAFYQHRFGGLAVKAGKLPIARGIYNEIRAVGTIMPFYRAPAGTYIEGFETLTGVSAAYTFNLGRSWSLETIGYGGTWTANIVLPAFTPGSAAGSASTAKPDTTAATAEVRSSAPSISRIHEDETVGGQAWLNTPLQGLRVGLSGMRFNPHAVNNTLPIVGTGNLWTSSIDGNFDRFLARAEFTHVAVAGHQIQYYGQAGVKLTERLGVYVEDDRADERIATGGGAYLRDLGSHDVGASVNYALAGGRAVLKLEQHAVKGHDFNTPVAPSAPSRTTSYTIASLSAAF